MFLLKPFYKDCIYHFNFIPIFLHCNGKSIRGDYMADSMLNVLRPGVKIRMNCHVSFGPLMSYFWGPWQSFKGPNFLISLMGLITVTLSPRDFASLAGPPGVKFEGPQAIVKAFGLRARLILTPGWALCQCSTSRYKWF